MRWLWLLLIPLPVLAHMMSMSTGEIRIQERATGKETILARNVTCEDASAIIVDDYRWALLEPPGTRCLLQCQRARQRTGSRGRETARRNRSDPLPTKYGHVA